jgi:hypothetical protein
MAMVVEKEANQLATAHFLRMRKKEISRHHDN